MKDIEQTPRLRATNFTVEECFKLLDVVDHNVKVIECKKTDAVTNKEKDDIWEVAAQQFNAGSMQRRTMIQLRSKYETLKKDARKYAALERRTLFKTGGGPTDFKPNPLLARVKALISLSAEGLQSSWDSDELPVVIEKTSNLETFLQDDFMITDDFEEETVDFDAVDPKLQKIIDSSAAGQSTELQEWVSSYSPAMLKRPKHPLLRVDNYQDEEPSVTATVIEPAMTPATPQSSTGKDVWAKRRLPTVPLKTPRLSKNSKFTAAWAEAKTELAKARKTMLMSDTTSKEKRDAELHELKKVEHANRERREDELHELSKMHLSKREERNVQMHRLDILLKEAQLQKYNIVYLDDD